jgi:hypothetical protein
VQGLDRLPNSLISLTMSTRMQTALEQIPPLDRLKTLDWTGPFEVQHLSKFPALEHLGVKSEHRIDRCCYTTANLNGLELTAAGLKSLHIHCGVVNSLTAIASTITGLQEISLRAVVVGNDGLAPLAALTKLRKLTLGSPILANETPALQLASLDVLQEFQALEELVINSELSSFEEAVKAPNLRRIVVRNSQKQKLVDILGARIVSEEEDQNKNWTLHLSPYAVPPTTF